jgi:hypothetical protein
MILSIQRVHFGMKRLMATLDPCAGYVCHVTYDAIVAASGWMLRQIF